MASSMGSFNLAKPDIKLEVKIDQFSGFLRDFEKRLAGSATMQQITDFEVSRVLEKAIKETGKADVAKMRSKIAGLRMITLHGKRIPLMNKKSGRFQRFPDTKWAQITSRKQVMLDLLLQARGLSARSWYILAKQLGFEVAAPNYVKAALPSKRRAIAAFENDVSFTRHKTKAGNYGLLIVNKMPILRFNPPSGLAALFTAIAGRIGYFKKNLSKGVFDDARASAAKYRGIQITTGT
jgi:hypothetical protein